MNLLQEKYKKEFQSLQEKYPEEILEFTLNIDPLFISIKHLDSPGRFWITAGLYEDSQDYQKIAFYNSSSTVSPEEYYASILKEMLGLMFGCIDDFYTDLGENYVVFPFEYKNLEKFQDIIPSSFLNLESYFDLKNPPFFWRCKKKSTFLSAMEVWETVLKKVKPLNYYEDKYEALHFQEVFVFYCGILINICYPNLNYSEIKFSFDGTIKTIPNTAQDIIQFFQNFKEDNRLLTLVAPPDECYINTLNTFLMAQSFKTFSSFFVEAPSLQGSKHFSAFDDWEFRESEMMDIESIIYPLLSGSFGTFTFRLRKNKHLRYKDYQSVGYQIQYFRYQTEHFYYHVLLKWEGRKGENHLIDHSCSCSKEPMCQFASSFLTKNKMEPVYFK